jgi:DNA (cytosine-5)-methyltransferase 1
MYKGINTTLDEGQTPIVTIGGGFDVVAIQGTVIGRSETAGPQGSGADASGAMFTLTKTDVHAVAQPVPYDFYQITAPVNKQNRKPGDPCHTLARDNAAHATIIQPYIGGVDYENNAHGMDEATGPLLKGSPTGGGRPLPAIVSTMQVRRLTPVECERLQGFPDGYTNIPWRNKPESPDGPRYKALGNSMAVPVMSWIGERINKVEAL